MKHSISVSVRRALAVGAMMVFAGAGSSAFAQSAVAWTGVVRATASGATLTKTSGCGDCYDAGAVSQQRITTGTVSFHVAPGQKLFAGLGLDTSTSTSYAAINYAFKFTGGSSWEIRESNVYRTEGTYAASDVFKISLSGSSVTYYRNGTLVYTSNVPASGTFALDTSISNIGGTIDSATVSGSASGTSLPPPPPPSSSATLRVLQWNTHHGGYGTDDVYSPNRLATWAASFNPDVIMFNEIEKNDSWGNQDQPEVYKSLLQQKTGRTWYYVFAQEFGNWSANGKGNLIMSRFPISVSDRYELVRNADRSIAMAEITVNGRVITLILTHLDPYDQALRLVQAQEVTGWSAVQPENRILTGDMNAWPDQTSIAHLNTLYNDSWAVAAAAGTATAFPGNNGETKKGRIDYIYYSKNAANLRVVSSQVYDTRDANGVMPSDHRPVLTVFEVR
jgi:endonuclease/exonuclease/phosphatase family metal-dependent hydrolase